MYMYLKNLQCISMHIFVYIVCAVHNVEKDLDTVQQNSIMQLLGTEVQQQRQRVADQGTYEVIKYNTLVCVFICI